MTEKREGAPARFASALRRRRMQPTTAPGALPPAGKAGPNDSGGFGLEITLSVELGGIDQAAAEQLVEAAHQVCPYSNATRGNIDVTVEAVAA